MAFTDAKVKSLKPYDERYIQWEDGSTGFGVRVSSSGKKTFILMYRFNGKARMMSIGNYSEMPLAEARTIAVTAKEAISKGIDPGKHLVEAKREHREAPLVSDLVEEYLEKWARPRKKSAAEDERILRREIIPLWGDRKAKSITRRDIIQLLDRIVERGAPIMANRTLAVGRKMFNFAIGRDIISTTPFVAISSPAKANRRDRVLSEDEIKMFWLGLNEANMSDGSRNTLRLQLSTAQRKGEITRAQWEEFDLKNRIWTIPAEKAKNGLPHRVSLSALTMEILEAVKADAKESPWLFPSPKNIMEPVAPTAPDHAMRRNLDKLKISHATPHDLRRTAASQMTSMGISRLVVSKILNHAENGVTAVYDRYSYDIEKRQALEVWGRKLETIISGKQNANVVLLAKQGMLN